MTAISQRKIVIFDRDKKGEKNFNAPCKIKKNTTIAKEVLVPIKNRRRVHTVN